MRVLILALITLVSVSAAAQSPFYSYHQFGDSAALARKWHLSSYGGISAGLGVFGVGSNSYLASPIGLQINRRLNNNFYAFAGVAAAPAYYNFNHAFNSTSAFKPYPGMNPAATGFGLQSRVEMGLMYINDARTFSISGSIGVTRGSYPAYPAYPVYGGSQKPISH